MVWEVQHMEMKGAQGVQKIQVPLQWCRHILTLLRSLRTSVLQCPHTIRTKILNYMKEKESVKEKTLCGNSKREFKGSKRSSRNRFSSSGCPAPSQNHSCFTTKSFSNRQRIKRIRSKNRTRRRIGRQNKQQSYCRGYHTEEKVAVSNRLKMILRGIRISI